MSSEDIDLKDATVAEVVEPATTVSSAMVADRNRSGSSMGKKASPKSRAVNPGAVAVSGNAGSEEIEKEEERAPGAVVTASIPAWRTNRGATTPPKARGQKSRTMAPANRPGAVAVSHLGDIADMAVQEPSQEEPPAVSAAAPSNSVSGSLCSHGKRRVMAPATTSAVRPGAVAVSTKDNGDEAKPKETNTSLYHSPKISSYAPAFRSGAIAVTGTAQMAKTTPSVVTGVIDVQEVTVSAISEPTGVITTSNTSGAGPTTVDPTPSIMPSSRRLGNDRRGKLAQLPGAIAVSGDEEPASSPTPPAHSPLMPSSRPDRSGKRRRDTRATAPEAVPAETNKSVVTTTSSGAPFQSRSSPGDVKSRRSGHSAAPGAVSSVTNQQAVVSAATKEFKNGSVRRKKILADSGSKASYLTMPSSRGARFTDRGTTSLQDKPEDEVDTDKNDPGAVPETGSRSTYDAKIHSKSGNVNDTSKSTAKPEGSSPVVDDASVTMHDLVFEGEEFVSNQQSQYRVEQTEQGSEATTMMESTPSGPGNNPPNHYLLPARSNQAGGEDQAPINAPVRPMEDWRRRKREIEMKAEVAKETRRKCRNRVLILLMVLVTGGAICSIIVGSGILSEERTSSVPLQPPTGTPSIFPTSTPSINIIPCSEHVPGSHFSDRFTALRELFVSEDVLLASIDTPGSHQRNALCWLSEFDMAQVPLSESTKLIERYAMGVLSYALEARDIGWLTPDPVCDWKLVKCRDDKVAEIVVTRSQLTGTIPLELALLTDLVLLDLRTNGLQGSLPTEIFSLPKLAGIFLADNALSGTLPTEMGFIEFGAGSAHFIDIVLGTNRFNGTIPTELAALQALRIFTVGGNQLSGPVPRFRSQVLETIDLRENRFSGLIPSPISPSPKLGILDLAENALSGTIPSFENHKQLMTLNLDQNNLNGTISPAVGNLTQMEFLVFNDNFLTGEIPSSLGQLTLLQELGLAGNFRLEGSMPLSVCSLRPLPLKSLSAPCRVDCSCCTELCS